MIQSVLQSFTSSPSAEPDDSDYDISVSHSTISQHVLSRRGVSSPSGPSDLPRTPRKEIHTFAEGTPRGNGAGKVRRMPVIGDVEEVIDMDQVVTALRTLEALIVVGQPGVEADFKTTSISVATQLITAMRGGPDSEELRTGIEQKDRGEVIMGIMVVSMKIAKLCVELGTPLLLQIRDLWFQILRNEFVRRGLQILGEIVLVGLSLVLSVLKAIQRYMDRE